MQGERNNHGVYQPDTDEYSDGMMSPFRLSHISRVTWKNRVYSGYAILVLKKDRATVSVKLTGNRSERVKIVGMLNSLEKLVRVEHSIATGRGFKHKDPLDDDQIESYKSESEKIRREFKEVGIDLP